MKNGLPSRARIVSATETAYVVTPNARRLDASSGSRTNVVHLDLVDGFGPVAQGPQLRLELMIGRESTLADVRNGLSLAWPELMAELRRAPTD